MRVVRWAGQGWRAAVMVAAWVTVSGAAQAADPPVRAPHPAFGLNASEAPALDGLSVDAVDTHRWVMAAADHGGLPFAIVDKKEARLMLFSGDGQLTASTPVLLGLAPGDHGVPGIGQRVPLRVAPEERTTPAGRFRSEPGRNLSGEDIVWVDYDAAIAIHRLRPGPDHERREQRLATPTPLDNRSSLGCVVVPVAFYDAHVAPVLGRQRGTVYVLPERQPAQAMLHAYQAGALKHP